jgi:GTP-binding protein EngB required for normal cell division
MTAGVQTAREGALSELTRPIADLCDEALPRLGPGRIRDGVAAVRFRLGEEGLRVVVAGRVSSGKSTLVNALLRRRIAPTAAGECTRVVTWFRYGVPARADVVTTAGKVSELPLIGGELPEELGAPLEDVESVVVYLPDESLRQMILIDTPGLSSVDEQRSDRTKALLAMHVATRHALAEADALVFLMSQTAREDDERALTAFAEATRGVDASAATTIGVLSMADKVAGGDLVQARQLAERFAAALHPKVAAVVPLVALVGEAAEILTERDAAHLERLAALDRETRDLAVSDVGLFRELATPVPPDERERLLRQLDLFGIAHSLELVDAGRDGASALAEALRELSGLAALRELLADTFEARADLLKAHSALAALERLAWQQAQSGTTTVRLSLRNAVERLRNRPEMHRINELWALEQAFDTAQPEPEGARGIPAELRADLARLAGDASVPARLGLGEDASVDALRLAALAGASRWQAFKVDGALTLREHQIADVLVRSFTLLWSDLEGRPA